MHVTSRDAFGAYTSAQRACIGVGRGAWRRRDTCGLVNDHVGSTSEPKDNQERLNWDAYLRLRKQRRLAGVVTTWPTTLLAAFGSSTYFLSQKMDPTQPLFGVRTVVLTRSLTQ